MCGIGPESVRASWGGFFGAFRIIDASLSDDQLIVLGDTAIAWGLFNITAVPVDGGEPVDMQAIGLHGAMIVSMGIGRVNGSDIENTLVLLDALGLPKKMATTSIDRLMDAMGFDKKVSGGRLRLILPGRAGGVEIVDEVPEDIIRVAWKGLMSG